MNINSPYKDIKIFSLDPLSKEITSAREIIIDELKSQKKDNKHMIDWYEDKRWASYCLDYCTGVYTAKGELISLSGNKIQPDNTMKVLCYYYMIKKYRTMYRSLSQTDIIPSNVEYAKEKRIKGIWFSVHVFDKRHARLSNSQKRFLNGGNLLEHQMPYWKKLKYVGNITYRGVEQEKFYMKVDNT